MPVSPTPDDSYFWEIAQAYQQAELEILEGIRNRLDKGIGLSDQAWATARLAEVQTLRRETTKQLAKVNQSMASKISGSFGNAYKDGELAALKDTAAFLPGKPSAVASKSRRRAVEAIARDVNGKTLKAMPGLLRQTEDQYRNVVKDTVKRVAAGGVDRRAATSKALQQAFGSGLKVGPGKWNLPDYMTMAVRTGTARALIEGHLDALEANDIPLVMIHPGPRHCERCDEWANVPLYRHGGKPGVHLFDSATAVKKTKVDVKGNLDQAKAAGWGHPNCRCNVGAFIPGASVAPVPRPPFDEEGYKAQQDQRVIERQIREWKTKAALSADPKEQAFANAKVAQWQKAMRSHMNKYPELKRQPHRESTKGTLGPGYSGPTSPPPKPKPKPKPKGPLVDPEPLVPPAKTGQQFDQWVNGLVNSSGDLGAAGKNHLKAALDYDDFGYVQDAYNSKLLTDGQFKMAQKAWDNSHPKPPADKVFAPEPTVVPSGIKITDDGVEIDVPKIPVTEPPGPKKKTPQNTPEKPSVGSSSPSSYVKPPAYRWDGKKKPEPPQEPPPPKTDKAVKLDTWLGKVKAKYEAFAKATNNPKSNLEQSNNWSYVKQALDGDTAAIKYLYNNKYLDDTLFREATDAIAESKRLDPAVDKAYKEALAEYATSTAKYKADLAKYRADNGITSAPKGFSTAIRHQNNNEGVQWAQKNLHAPQHGTPGGDAARVYSGSAYHNWNAALRQTDGKSLPAGTYKNKTKALDEAMRPSPADVIVHRGTGFAEFSDLGSIPPPPPTSIIGKAYQNKGYVSTSVGSSAAFSGSVKLEILVPEGYPVLNVMPVSNYGTAEREILLARGTTYFVHDVQQESAGVWKVRVEVVPQGEDPAVWTPLPGGG